MIQQQKSNFEVLAKSEPQVTLRQHIEDCLNIEKQLEFCFPNIPVDEKQRFWDVLRSSICFHDAGKSHKGFQKMLYKGGSFNMRHELFSVVFINQSSLSDDDKSLISYAVLGHHKDLAKLNTIVLRDYGVMPTPGFVTIGGTSFSSDCESLLKNKAWRILNAFNYQKANDDILDIVKTIKDFKKETLEIGSKQYLWKLLLVGFLKQCDHLASAGIGKIHTLSSVNFCFLHNSTFSLYQHQEAAYQHIGSAFLSAPTGSGKTESSLLWLEKQLSVKGQGRVFYILPYIASINAMYERLNSDFGDSHHYVGMMHGKLSQYFESKFESNSYDNLTDIEDFKTLVTPFKIVTPFQMLKHLFGLKGFEKGISEWCGGYFIFDEIHAYDSRTFAQIIVLLEYCVRLFNVSVFIMTATMPSYMLKLLSDAVGQNIHIRADKRLYDTFDRHKVRILDGLINDYLSKIQSDIDTGCKVLVVCNTVEQSQYMYNALACNSKLLLHGSFNAVDRSAKEQTLYQQDIRLFVGTQAIEVSLDIDYDTIYSEPAPIDALIQRFGRVNRKRKKGLCICHVFRESNEKDHFIYNQDVVQRSIEVLDRLDNDKIIHEEQIQQMIDYVYPDFEVKQKSFVARIDYQLVAINTVKK